tara:strand:+ start:392 stop:559 length:168 start_codon:yes stop_codon:yes gene_type:complete
MILKPGMIGYGKYRGVWRYVVIIEVRGEIMKIYDVNNSKVTEGMTKYMKSKFLFL